MIKTVIRLQNDTVMVFDEAGEQMPIYQGRYTEVRGNILQDAPVDAVFTHWFGYASEQQAVSRNSW